MTPKVSGSQFRSLDRLAKAVSHESHHAGRVQAFFSRSARYCEVGKSRRRIFKLTIRADRLPR